MINDANKIMVAKLERNKQWCVWDSIEPLFRELEGFWSDGEEETFTVTFARKNRGWLEKLPEFEGW